MPQSLESHLKKVARLWQRLGNARTCFPEERRARLDPLTRAQNAVDAADELAGTLTWLSRQGLSEQQIRIVLAVSALEGEKDFAEVARQLGLSRQGVRDSWLRAWRKISPGKAAADGLLG